MLLFASLINYLLLTLTREVFSDYYSSIVGLEKLFDMEEKMLVAVENLIGKVQNRYEKIESFLHEIELYHRHMRNDSQYFLRPVNAFKIVKRFVIDWRNYDKVVDMAKEINDFNETISNLMSDYIQPSKEDLLGAVAGLSRLQNVYQLDTKNIAKGYILDHKYSETLTAHDCYIMGLYLFTLRNYLKSSEWLVQALQQLINSPALETGYPFVSKTDVLVYLSPALYNCGNYKLAHSMNLLLLQIDPENTFGLKNKNLLRKAVLKERRSMKLKRQTENSKYNILYHQLCRGEVIRPGVELRSLHCHYVTNNLPYYFIGPLKMEKLNHDPFVAIYHQTIHDNEIEYILKKVGNKVVRSAIRENEISSIRTSKQTWLYWNEHTFMKKLYQRLEDITGLDLSTGEPMQVANYGIGGHYALHYDFIEDIEESSTLKDNRLLTAMFYINNVELGGATVFPYLRLTVPNVKYSLLVWYNLHESTELDYRTAHSGCPVLKGSKWICNQWFHEGGQEFKRPCGLQKVGDKHKYSSFPI